MHPKGLPNAKHAAAGATFSSLTGQDDLPDKTVNAILEDRAGNLWFGTQNGVYRYDGSTLTAVTSKNDLPNNAVNFVLEDRAGYLWFGTRGGASRYDGATFTTFTTQDGLADNWVDTILEDQAGHLWFSTDSGVSRYEGEDLSVFNTDDGLSHNTVQFVLQDRANQLWLGTKQGVSRYDGKTFKKFTPLADTDVRSIYEDKTGTLWFGTHGGGISRFDGNQLKVYGTQNGLAHNNVNTILEDSKATRWFGTHGGGISRLDGETFTNFTTTNGLAGNWVFSILEDSAGTLWFGTNRGLSRFDGETFTNLNSRDGLADDWVWSILEDSAGNLWIGTKVGVSRYDGQAFQNFTTLDGLADNGVRSILEDNTGTLWFGTNGGGISRYHDQVFQTLRQRDGLVNNRVYSMLQDQKGAVWLGTGAGLMHYSPDHTPPRIYLENLVADREYGAAKAIRLPTRQSTLAFEYSGVSLKTLPNQIVYLYRLEGHEQTWQQTRKRRVQYKNLPVGEYTFQLKAVDRDLTYSQQQVEVQVEVYFQEQENPVRIAGFSVGPLFASFYQSYNSNRSVGEVQLINDSPDTIQVELSLDLPDLMRRPSTPQRLRLNPHQRHTIPLHATLDKKLLELTDILETQAQLTLAVETSDKTFPLEENKNFRVFDRGSLIWDNVGRAAAFITSQDPLVDAFARKTLVAFENTIRALGQPGRALLQALVLFEALKQHGIHYIPDANTPYDQARSQRAKVDHIKYPAHLLQTKTGDCDDLTVLYASLLENVGISTALVDLPGHIFLLFDTGVDLRNRYQLPLNTRYYRMRGDRLWIPVEVTKVNQSFLEAWQAGVDQLDPYSLRELRHKFVNTADAWKQYPAAQPTFDKPVDFPAPAALKDPISTQYNTLQVRINKYIDETYLYPLKLAPDRTPLRTRLLKVYLALERFEQAIDKASADLVERHGDKAATLNHRGNAFLLKGNLTQALVDYQEAMALRPTDQKIRRNLQLARQRYDRNAATEVRSDSTGDTRADMEKLQVDDLYWFE